MQVVHLDERNSGGAVHPSHDCGVVTRREVGDNRRFARVRWGVAAILYILDLVAGDDAADDRLLPIIVKGNQSAGVIVQFQCWIGQGIRNAKLTELGANRAYDHVLRFSPSYDELAYHYVIASPNKATSTNVAQNRLSTGAEIIRLHKSDSRRVL